MLNNELPEKIRQVYNKLEKSISSFDELVYTNKYIPFNLYRGHCEILSLSVENNILFKFSLLMFREFFEGENYFKGLFIF